MNSINRAVIFLMLLALLYALYTYQQQILNVASIDRLISSGQTDSKKANKKKARKPDKKNNLKACSTPAKKKKIAVNKIPQNLKNTRLEIKDFLPKDNESVDKVSLGGISQMSLGSLEDLQTMDDVGYKQDSILESLESRNSLGSLLDDQSNDFFFQ